MSNIRLRRATAVWFLALYLLIGVPVWYKLTTIHRAPLPAEYIESLYKGNNHDVHMVIPVYIMSKTFKFPDLHDAVQLQVNHMLQNKERYVNWSLQVLPYPEDGSVDLHNEYVVILENDESPGFVIPSDGRKTILFHNLDNVLHNDLPFFVSQSLVEHTFQLEWNRLNKKYTSGVDSNRVKNMAIEYNPNVHLSISLLSGDGNPVSWEIEHVALKYLTPLRQFLSPLVNFTIDTNIIYFNDLNLHHLKNRSSLSQQDLSQTIDLSELSSANYYEEQNCLHLAIVFPSNSTGSLPFINSDKHWKSFLVPQWGTLIINDEPLPENPYLSEDYLAPVMHKFSNELLQLLGFTEDSEGLSSPVITLDSFKRLTILNNLNHSINTLWSLVKMTSNLPQMTIPIDVLTNVKDALDLRLETIEMLNNPAKQNSHEVWNDALIKSNKLVYLCEKAFFHKEMVQQMFLPQEHKVAVYLPLLGPISIVTIAGFLKIWREQDSESDDDTSTEEGASKEKMQ